MNKKKGLSWLWSLFLGFTIMFILMNYVNKRSDIKEGIAQVEDEVEVINRETLDRLESVRGTVEKAEEVEIGEDGKVAKLKDKNTGLVIEVEDSEKSEEEILQELENYKKYEELSEKEYNLKLELFLWIYSIVSLVLVTYLLTIRLYKW